MILFTVIQTYYTSVRFLSKSLASEIDLRRRFLCWILCTSRTWVEWLRMVIVPVRAHPTPAPSLAPPRPLSVFLVPEGVHPAEADAKQSWAGNIKVSTKHRTMCK